LAKSCVASFGDLVRARPHKQGFRRWSTAEISLGGEVSGVLASNIPVVAAADLSGLDVQMLLGRTF
jgi:hypothetical protein